MRLLRGEERPSEAADWAGEFIRFDDTQIYPEVEDPVVWRALDQLAGADLPASPNEALHDEVDFAEWLAELREAPDGGG